MASSFDCTQYTPELNYVQTLYNQWQGLSAYNCSGNGETPIELYAKDFKDENYLCTSVQSVVSDNFLQKEYSTDLICSDSKNTFSFVDDYRQTDITTLEKLHKVIQNNREITENTKVVKYANLKIVKDKNPDLVCEITDDSGCSTSAPVWLLEKDINNIQLLVCHDTENELRFFLFQKVTTMKNAQSTRRIITSNNNEDGKNFVEVLDVEDSAKIVTDKGEILKNDIRTELLPILTGIQKLVGHHVHHTYSPLDMIRIGNGSLIQTATVLDDRSQWAKIVINGIIDFHEDGLATTAANSGIRYAGWYGSDKINEFIPFLREKIANVTKKTGSELGLEMQNFKLDNGIQNNELVKFLASGIQIMIELNFITLKQLFSIMNFLANQVSTANPVEQIQNYFPFFKMNKTILGVMFTTLFGFWTQIYSKEFTEKIFSICLDLIILLLNGLKNQYRNRLISWITRLPTFKIGVNRLANLRPNILRNYFARDHQEISNTNHPVRVLLGTRREDATNFSYWYLEPDVTTLTRDSETIDSDRMECVRISYNSSDRSAVVEQQRESLSWRELAQSVNNGFVTDATTGSVHFFYTASDGNLLNVLCRNDESLSGAEFQNLPLSTENNSWENIDRVQIRMEDVVNNEIQDNGALWSSEKRLRMKVNYLADYANKTNLAIGLQSALLVSGNAPNDVEGTVPGQIPGNLETGLHASRRVLNDSANRLSVGLLNYETIRLMRNSFQNEYNHFGGIFALPTRSRLFSDNRMFNNSIYNSLCTT